MSERTGVCGECWMKWELTWLQTNRQTHPRCVLLFANAYLRLTNLKTTVADQNLPEVTHVHKCGNVLKFSLVAILPINEVATGNKMKHTATLGKLWISLGLNNVGNIWYHPT